MRALFAVAAAALSLALLASATTRDVLTASGLCQDTQKEPRLFALLQTRARYTPALSAGAPPPVLTAADNASSADSPATAKRPALAAAQAAANISVGQFPDILPPGLLPPMVTGAMKTAEAQALLVTLEAVLEDIDRGAKEFLLKARQYRDALLNSIGASTIQALKSLEALVLAKANPVCRSFDAVVEKIMMLAPAAVAFVGVLGLDKLASELQAAMESIQSQARVIDYTLGKATETVSVLVNAKVEQTYAELKRLNQTTEAGIVQAQVFEDALLKMLKNALTEVAEGLGISIVSNAERQERSPLAERMEVLLQKLEETVAEIRHAWEDFFLGTSEASVVAVNATEHSKKSGSEGLRLSFGLLLLIMGLATHR